MLAVVRAVRTFNPFAIVLERPTVAQDIGCRVATQVVDGNLNGGPGEGLDQAYGRTLGGHSEIRFSGEGFGSEVLQLPRSQAVTSNIRTTSERA